MMDMFRHLQDQLGKVSVPAPASRTVDQERVKDLQPGEERLEEAKDSLLPVIDQLCSLADEKECVMRSEAAEDVIKAIQSCIQYLKDVSPRPDEEEKLNGRERLKTGEWDTEEVARDLRTLEGITLSSRDISLNQSGEFQESSDG